jgi:hypothetical protein
MSYPRMGKRPRDPSYTEAVRQQHTRIRALHHSKALPGLGAPLTLGETLTAKRGGQKASPVWPLTPLCGYARAAACKTGKAGGSRRGAERDTAHACRGPVTR